MSMHDRINEKFLALLQEGEEVLRQSGWNGLKYDHFPSDIDYRRFRTEAMNLVRRVCGEDSDHYQELRRLAEDDKASGNSFFFKDCVGVLQAAYRDYGGGYLFDLRALVAAELLGDFIDQAENLVSQGYYVPAASLAGAVLEDTLRKLCVSNGIPIPEKAGIDRLNAELAKAGLYSKLVQKRITALADVRNNADHGHFDKFAREDVEDMVKWLRRFAADYLE